MSLTPATHSAIIWVLFVLESEQLPIEMLTLAYQTAMSGSLSVRKIHKMTSWEFPSAPLTTANPPNFPWIHVCHRRLSVSSRGHMFPVTLPIYETSSPFPPPLVILTFFCHCTARSLLYCCVSFSSVSETQRKKENRKKYSCLFQI